MKVKITKEQFINHILSLQGLQYAWVDRDLDDEDLIIEINESQIVKEKTNVEKWREIITRVSQCIGSYKEDYALIIAENYNADAAPKKTVLKAPAITRYSEQHPHHLGQILFRTLDEAKETFGEVFISFPAKIRMKDGTEQELWFVCEDE